MSDARTQMLYDAQKKSVLVAYLLWFFFGMFGVHHFYLGRTGSGAAILVLTLVSVPLMFVLVGFVTILIPTIWWLVDLFRIPDMTRDVNLRLIQRIT